MSNFVTCHTLLPKREACSPTRELKKLSQPSKRCRTEGEPVGLTGEVQALRKEMEEVKKNQKEILDELKMIRHGNFNGFERVMTRIDENQEAIARITLAVNNYDTSQRLPTQVQADNDGEEPSQPVKEGDYWKLGSTLRRITAKDLGISRIQAGSFSSLREETQRILEDIFAS
ncbi:hypothetical protein Clacol_008239 [Clathrus columnatus]|uniref:Uncharacterized protein n=1 Tax=Clathrus columnatus TaxID=1419009 RepID=A0AAV5AH58_9AGAM|nr:hypothetical protein Clacol_008239 [Clathrus columnatus]